MEPSTMEAIPDIYLQLGNQLRHLRRSNQIRHQHRNRLRHAAGGAKRTTKSQTPTGYALQPTTQKGGNAITTDKKAAEETTNKSTSETIAETVLANVDEGKKSLTIKNAPDT